MVFLKDNEDIQMLPKVGIVRKERVLKALRWLQENNQHYHDIQIDESVLEIDIVELDPEYVESEDNLDHIIPSHVNFTQYQETIQVPISNGAFAERSYSAGLYQVPNNVEDRKSFTIKGAMNNWIKHASDGLLAQFHNTELMDIFGDLSWIPMSYPTLFPFGKTGPGAIRMAKVTFEEWINHLLQVKDGRFREHFDFPLFMFNIVQRRKVSMSTK
jgi:hypothetical protein